MSSPDDSEFDTNAILQRRRLLLGTVASMFGVAVSECSATTVQQTTAPVHVSQGTAAADVVLQDASVTASVEDARTSSLPPEPRPAVQVLALLSGMPVAPEPAPAVRVVAGRRVYIAASACLTIGEMSRLSASVEAHDGAVVVTPAEVRVLAVRITQGIPAPDALLLQSFFRGRLALPACAVRASDSAQVTARITFDANGLFSSAALTEGTWSSSLLDCLFSVLRETSLPGIPPNMVCELELQLERP